MFDYYYHGTTRKLIAAFGSLFSGIVIARAADDATVESVVSVPIRYAPIDKRVAFRTIGPGDEDLEDKFASFFPRMLYTLTGFSYDGTRKRPTLHRSQVPASGDDNDDKLHMLSTFSPAPYNYEFELLIVSHNQTDALQIVEQILPYFQPNLNLELVNTPVPGTNLKVPVVLTGVTSEDSYDDQEAKRIVLYTMTFQAKNLLYGPAGTELEKAVTQFVDQNGDPRPATACTKPTQISSAVAPIILTVIVDMYTTDFGFDPDSNDSLERITVQPDPRYATKHDDVTKYDTTIEEDPAPRPEHE